MDNQPVTGPPVGPTTLPIARPTGPEVSTTFEVRSSETVIPTVIPPAKQPCKVCGSEIALKARQCTVCKGYQDGVDCVVCSYAMPKGVSRCPSCKAFQGFFRRRIPGSEVVLALLVTLLSVLSGFLPQLYSAWNYRSNTRIHVLGAKKTQDTPQKEYVILVQAINSGGRAAFIRSVDLRFPELPIKPVLDVEIDNPEHRLLLPDKPVVLRLIVKGLPARVAQPQVIEALKVGSPVLKVFVTVDETKRDGDSLSVVREGECRAARLKGLFERYVPN